MCQKFINREVLVLAFLSLPVLAAGQLSDPESDDRSVHLAQPTTPLADILEVVKKKSGKSFIPDPRVPLALVTGQLESRDFDYSTLLLILRNNGLAAVSAGNIVNIIPNGSIRMYPLPVLYEDDDAIDGEEWVTRIVQVQNGPAAQLVPIMRPLLPQTGHLAAHPLSNTIVIADRYANVKRITSLISRIDSLTPPQSE